MTKALPYQHDGIELLHKFGGRALLADEMGLGKTFQALAYAHECGDAWPALVICPAFAKYTWQNQALEHFRLRSEVCNGRQPPTRRLLIPSRLVIINYDILKDWIKYIKILSPKLVIVDECHFIGNPKSKRSKLVKHICSSADKVICMSGTPFTNQPIQMWPVINMLWPKKFGNFRRFAKRHCKPKRRWYGWTFPGAEKLDELHAKAQRCGMIRRLKSEVMKDLPPKQRIVVPLPIKGRKQYQEAVTDFRSWARKHGKGKLRFSKAEELVKVGYLKRLAAKLKLVNAIEWIDNLMRQTDDKIIVFAIHKQIIKALRLHYGSRCVVIDGSTSQLKRHQYIEQFHSDRKTRLLVGNIQAAGTNWSCKCSSTVVFLELNWTPGEHVQAEDRIHGLGRGAKGRSASIYYLVAKDTIEERLCNLLQTKQGNLHHAIDGRRIKELNIFEILVKELKRAA